MHIICKPGVSERPTVLGDCIYCGELLTNELQSVACDHCGEGFHIECARERDEFVVDVESHLFSSNSYKINCPNCGDSWSVGFDPRE